MGTLFILGTHKIIINILNVVIGKLGVSYNDIVYPVLYAVIVCIVCFYPIAWCRKKAPYILGK